jgi:transcriptional regulator with XRE-family HTH domain
MIGKQLKNLLKKHNMTQKELCSRLNISQGSMSGFVNDCRNPDFKTLMSIAGFFNVEIHSFITESRKVLPHFIPLSLLRESDIFMNTLAWVSIDSGLLKPAFEKDAAVLVSSSEKPAGGDTVLYFIKKEPKLARLIISEESLLLLPFSKAETPLNLLKSTANIKLYKVILTARKI